MTFAQPAWLILLVLLPLLGAGAVLVARLRRRQWTALVAPRLRAALLKRGSPLPRWLALLFLLAACAAIIVALARPQGDAGTRTEKTVGRNLLIALDLSRSMRVSDVKPDRLAQAKLVIYELLDAMPNERIGIIGFAGSAYLYAPLTVDHRAVRETVEQIDETWAPLGGSDLASAIDLAIDTLKKTGQKNNALVIISDGEKHEGDLDRMISEAEKSGVYILAIGVGTEDGDYVPNPDFPGNRMVDRNGKPVISRLQPEVMRKLAAETNGRYAVAGTGMDIAAMVKSAITDLGRLRNGRPRAADLHRVLSVAGAPRDRVPHGLHRRRHPLAGRQRRARRRLRAVAGSRAARSPRESRSPLRKRRSSNSAIPKRATPTASSRTSSHFADRKARFRLGEATAAYRGGDFKDARVRLQRRDAHRRSGRPDEGPPRHGQHACSSSAGADLDRPIAIRRTRTRCPTSKSFDILVRERLAKLKENANPEAEEPQATRAWKPSSPTGPMPCATYDSALATDPASPAARHNRDMTMIYLKRLAELLEEDKQQTEQSMPQPQPQRRGQAAREDGDEGEDKKPGDKGDEGDQAPWRKGRGTKGHRERIRRRGPPAEA